MSGSGTTPLGQDASGALPHGPAKVQGAAPATRSEDRAEADEVGGPDGPGAPDAISGPGTPGVISGPGAVGGPGVISAPGATAGSSATGRPGPTSEPDPTSEPGPTGAISAISATGTTGLPSAAGGVGIIRQLADWASRLDLDEAPERVVAHLKSQILSQLGAARAGYGHPLGQRIRQAYGSPLQDDPKHAVHSLSMATVCLDFDDTAYAGHLSHSTVNVPLTYASSLGLDGPGLLTSVLAANESAARVTAAATLGPFRGQTAGHTHLAGAVAGRLRAENASADTWTHALGMAFSVPTWSLSRGFFSTDAKVLVAAVPVQIGLSACDGARFGLTGPEDVLEHPQGFLHRFADIPLPEEALAGLGTLWHTETFSYKIHPGSAYTSAAVDCAVELHSELAGVGPGDIAEVVVEGSIFTAGLDRIARQHRIGPDSSVAALNFSLPYNVATALLTGSLLPADLAHPAVARPDRWELAARVRTQHDPAFSRHALLATAPLGQALRRAGERAEAWVRAIDARAADALPAARLEPETDFRWATKNLGARVTVRLRDGRELRAERRGAVGAASGAEGIDHAGLARAKFLACGGDPEAAELILRLEELSPEEVRRLVRLALAGLDGPAEGPSTDRPVSTAAQSTLAAQSARSAQATPVTAAGRKDTVMETAVLEEAYAALITAATAAPLDHPASSAGLGERDADWTLAHVALSDRLLASTARQVLSGEAAGLDNGPAMDPKAIEELTSSVGRDVLVELVRRNAAEFVGLIAQTPHNRQATPVTVRLVGDEGEELFSGAVPWGEIVRLRAEEHIPAHSSRLRRIARAPQES
ncbi:MmgE/PrpD family protein [Streptomyces sp. NPDC007084]|uniref:MmgE/PrpD family protein n=1 Tax=Streptomyces sp. NPDC007084 TaxID=3154313 RepID=UPI003456AAFA